MDQASLKLPALLYRSVKCWNFIHLTPKFGSAEIDQVYYNPALK